MECDISRYLSGSNYIARITFVLPEIHEKHLFKIYLFIRQPPHLSLGFVYTVFFPLMNVTIDSWILLHGRKSGLKRAVRIVVFTIHNWITNRRWRQPQPCGFQTSSVRHQWSSWICGAIYRRNFDIARSIPCQSTAANCERARPSVNIPTKLRNSFAEKTFLAEMRWGR